MVVLENKKFSLDYVDPNKRSIANALQVIFNDGSHTLEIVVEYPLGHKRRREEAIPFLKQKFVDNLATRIAEKNCTEIHQLFADQGALENIRVDKFMDLFVV